MERMGHSSSRAALIYQNHLGAGRGDRGGHGWLASCSPRRDGRPRLAWHSQARNTSGTPQPESVLIAACERVIMALTWSVAVERAKGIETLMTSLEDRWCDIVPGQGQCPPWPSGSECM